MSDFSITNSLESDFTFYYKTIYQLLSVFICLKKPQNKFINDILKLYMPLK